MFTKKSFAIAILSLLISLSAYAADQCPTLSSYYCFAVPEYAPTISGKVFIDDIGAPLNTTYVTLFAANNSNVAVKPITWDVSDFTQLSPRTYNNKQVGFYKENPAWYGSTAAQMQRYQKGLHLHTWSTAAENVTESEGDLVTLQVKRKISPPIYPWNSQNGQNKLCFSYRAAVPNSYPVSATVADYAGGQKTANYAFGILIFQEKITGRFLHMVNIFYDNRGLFESSVGSDSRVGAFIGTYFGATRYSELVPSSYSAQSQLWDDYRFFGVCVSSAHLRVMIDDINSQIGDLLFATNTEDYAVIEFVVGLEIAQPRNWTNGHLSMKAEELWLYSPTQ